ncbi:MAG: hypothetical protein OER82_05830 [Nitrosopumilus sp.]|nr:hypothetical protein [Nitrosopumilus sp.]
MSRILLQSLIPFRTLNIRGKDAHKMKIDKNAIPALSLKLLESFISKSPIAINDISSQAPLNGIAIYPMSIVIESASDERESVMKKAIGKNANSPMIMTIAIFSFFSTQPISKFPIFRLVIV